MELQATGPLNLADYLPGGALFDGCKSADGSVRRGWQPIVDWSTQIGPAGLDKRTSQLEMMIRDSGATFRSAAETASVTTDGERSPGRPWKLATVPHAIDASSWSFVEVGLQQRARLLEAVLDDLLGPQTLIRQRILPPELLWKNPSFRRVYHGLPVAVDDTGQAQRLIVTGTDLARGVDGSWWVVGDRTRAPSGLGYLLENRVVTSQTLSNLIRQCNVRRVAAFFVKLRSRLQSLAPRMHENPRIALLTPGEKSYRYFEDAYLARYLGYMLVQGSDLAVRGDRLNFRTLGGLVPIEVVWRHVSDRQCDPLELDPHSAQGVTGLLRMVRRGSVAIGNAIGSALVQMPALLPFLPAACKHLLGEDLKLPSIDTYWCGGLKEREHVLANLDQFMIRPAFVIDREPPQFAGSLSSDQKAELASRIRANPAAFVAQQTMNHATTPVWHEGRFRSWHFSLRSFQILDGDQVEVLPGGLARADPEENRMFRSPTSGQLTMDCWVVDEQPAAWDVSLLPDPNSRLELQRGGSDLSSRVAEHLFWLGRYVERCESIARLLRTTLRRLAGEGSTSRQSEIPQLIAALAGIGQIEPDYAIDELGGSFPSLETVLPESVFDTIQPEGLQSAAKLVVSNATAVRDRLSTDAYRVLKRVAEELSRRPSRATSDIGFVIEKLNRLLVDLLAFAGLSSDSMTRTHAWRFLQLGRRIERTNQTIELISAGLVSTIKNERNVFEAVLEASDSLMTYHARYMNLVRPIPVIDLLVTDDSNPRSLAFQLKDIDRFVSELPRDPNSTSLRDDQLQAKSLLHEVEMANPNALGVSNGQRREQLEVLLQRISEGLPRLSDAIAAQYFFHTATTQELTGIRYRDRSDTPEENTESGSADASATDSQPDATPDQASQSQSQSQSSTTRGTSQP
ncbi:hypothetical protein Mal65_00780 [Crateriforma conspicua]|nr:hypothetical protein Mal65_00780 [Crateriforma conspicua]